MSNSIGRLLGEHLGILEEDLRGNPLDPTILESMGLVAGIYRNLKDAGITGFEGEFKTGYENAKNDALRDATPASPALDIG